MGFLQLCFLFLGPATLLPGGFSGKGCSDNNQFQCNDGFCIPESWTCDGYFHCPDNSDEANCTCSSDQFTCKNSLCIPTLWRCDGFNQCGDNSDEANCTCSTSQFACKNGHCIPASWACEGHDDCGDLSDEANCTCTSSQFTCDNRRCIPEYYTCNGFDDCGDDSDEAGCPCSSFQFLCHDGSCVPRRYLCDGLNDCGDASDEANCSLSCPSGQFRCLNSLCIPVHWTCDQYNDCGDHTDEAGCRQPCASYQFTCNSGLCIPMLWTCDGYDDCGDDSDKAYTACANQSSLTHSLRYVSMSVSQPSQGVPWFSMEGYLDGQPFERYDSNTRRNVPVEPWMEKVEKDFPHYWDWTTNNRRLTAVMSGMALELVRSHFNHTEEPPIVKVTRKAGNDSQETLICRAYGFYPEQIQTTWRKNSEVLEQKTSQGSVVPNSDGTYHTWLSTTIDPKERGLCQCHVEHSGLPEPVDVAWKNSDEGHETWNGSSASSHHFTLGLLVGLFGAWML